MTESDNFSFKYRTTCARRSESSKVSPHRQGRLRRLLDRVGNDHLDRVLGAAARMNLMIDALLTLARLSYATAGRQPVNLSQLAGY